MTRDNFEVISLLGPLGSGKTTTLNNLIEHVPASDSYAVVVNDVGQNNIDARRIWDHPANRSEKIIPLTAGCIGCSDVTQFREALEKVHDAGVNVLFIEPTGIAPGHEIADVVCSSGFDLSILTLTNAQTVERDTKWQVLPSQIAVADIIGVTHIPDDENELEVLATVLSQLPPLPERAQIELIRHGDTDYFELLAKLRGLDKQLKLGRQAITLTKQASECCQGTPAIESQTHDHRHDRAHNISAKSYEVKPGIGISEIKQLLMPYTNYEQPLLRAKGFIGDQRFDVVGSEWTADEPEQTLGSEPSAKLGTPSTMNVIFAGSIPESFSVRIKDITQIHEETSVSLDKKAVVKSISGLPVSERTQIIEQRLELYPSPISLVHGELIPDCEADEGYEIAFWGLNDDIPDEFKRRAMEKYIDFRLGGLHELNEHPENIANCRSKAPYWMRRYGATLGYNGYYLSEHMSEETREKVRQSQPAKMLSAGISELDCLTYDEGRAEEKPEFVAQVFKAALSHGDLSSEEIRQTLNHLRSLAESNPLYLERLVKSFKFLDDSL